MNAHKLALGSLVAPGSIFVWLRAFLRSGWSGVPARRLGLATALTMLGALSLASAPAFAEITHRYETQIAGPSLVEPFTTPWGLTFDAAGNLYVPDAEQAVVDKFNSTNEFQTQIGRGSLHTGYARNVAVSSSGTVYVGDSQCDCIQVFNAAGAKQAEWTGTKSTNGSFGGGYVSVAIDNSTSVSDAHRGDVYVQSTAFQTVDIYKPTGETEEGSFEGELATPPEGFGFSNNSGLSVDDGTGRVYVPDGAHNSVDEFSSTGAFEGTLTGAETPQGAASFVPTAVAVDGADKLVYVIDEAGKVVDEFSTTGTFLGEIKQTEVVPGEPKPLVEPLGVAVQEHAGATRGDVYVSDGAAHVVDVFSAAGIVVPGVVTGTASGLTPTEATLDGSVNPAGNSVSACVFEYRTTAEATFTHSVPCKPSAAEIGAGSSPVAVSAKASGLTALTSYYYRLSATNANGTNHGVEATFYVPGAPQVRDESAQVDTTEKAGQTTATLGAQVDPGGRETTYRFEYGETTAYGASVPVPDGTLAAAEEFQSVPSAELTGLKVDTVYHYRVSAHNQYGTVLGPDQEFTTLTALLVKVSVSHVTATSATLEAQVNPLGSDTQYYFQYGTVDCATAPSSCTSAPVPPVDVGSGESTVEGTPVHLNGLQASTTYHYRIVATNSLGTTEGGDETFTTQTTGGFSLPDGRAWELVSPPDKHGALILGLAGESLSQASASGDAVTYLASASTESQPAGNSNETQVLSTRAEGGWGSRDIATPRDVANGLGNWQEYRFFSADLSLALVEPLGVALPPLSSEATERTPFLRTDYTGGNPADPCLSSCYRPLVTGAAGVVNVPLFVSASVDGKHVVLSSRVSPAEGAPVGSLYEWAEGQLQPVSILPKSEGGATVPGSLGSPNDTDSTSGNMVRNAISADGSRVVWSTGGSTARLYVRDVALGETVLLGAGAEYQTASGDGARVFFTKGGDLYVFEAPVGGALSAGHVTDLAAGANVVGVVPGASADGSSIYFVANGALTSTPNGHGESPVAGSCISSDESEQPPGSLCNLYAWHDGATKLVAVLSGVDDRQAWSTKGLTDTRVSPNGDWLAFMSDRSLTGYDNRDVASEMPDEEVYLYDATANGGEGELVCASCNPTGARPHGFLDEIAGGEYPLVDHQFAFWGHWLAANVPVWSSPSYQSRYLSDSGRLFFNSSDALVASDTNGTNDVYEYEPPGVGDCTSGSATFSPRSGGCVDLISSGTGREESAFIDASESGDDVFFITSAQLSSQDLDSVADVYDARVGGGFPLPQPPPACEGDACQSPVGAPNDPTPGSLTFHGPGDLLPAVTVTKVATKKTVKCAKGKKLSHGKCVKVKKKAKKAKKRAKNGKASDKRRAKS